MAYACILQNGTNITITGSGTNSDPYIITSSGSTDLTNYVGIVNIQSPDDDISISSGLGTTTHLGGDDNNATIECGPDGIQLAATAMGFFGSFPVAIPHVPATPTAQNIVDALVALGLIVQD